MDNSSVGRFVRYNTAVGIRYYAWAITSDESEEARVDPWSVIRRADERHDVDGWTNTDLDKAWWQLQRMFAERPSCGSSAPRDAHRLVAGDVTYPDSLDGGYRPHVAIVDVEQVRSIATDLESITAADVTIYCARSDRHGDSDYLTHYLQEAQSFTADAASRGHAVIYLIK